MPLDGKDRQTFVIEGFHHKILRVLGHTQTLAYGAGGLMVCAVHQGAGTVEPVQKGSFCGLCPVDAVPALPGMKIQRGRAQILPNRPSKARVDNLKAFADAEDRFSGLYKSVEQGKLRTFPPKIRSRKLFVCMA